MTLFKSSLFVLLLLIPSSIVFAQTTLYTGYKTSFPFVTTCSSDQYYDSALLQCSPCPSNAKQKSDDYTKCDCIDETYFYGVNQGGGSLLCIKCDSNYIRSSDGFGCVTTNLSCDSTGSRRVKIESELDGNLVSPVSSPSNQPRVGGANCITCQNGTWPDSAGQRCTSCANITPRRGIPDSSINCCVPSATQDGICLNYVEDTLVTSFLYLNRFSSSGTSVFITQHIKAAFFLCRMNINATIVRSTKRQLLSNATACQLLGNIAVMQLYYDINGYAYTFYYDYIWNPSPSLSVWESTTVRVSIPFLSYPSTYYQEINSNTYNWINAVYNQNDPLRIKLAKYSATGQFLGLFDAFDTHIQLCGGGYTEGRAAFKFGAQFKKSCIIRADALWNSTLYETAFFDPYVVFTRNGSDYMIPCPVVIQDYQTATGSYPNTNADEAAWSYHRRFFLLDRLSGIINSNGKNELRVIRYAKTIKVTTTLTNGETYIQPPTFFIDYDEISLSEVGKENLIQISFESSYRMDLNNHIINIWIATGVLAFLGVILAFVRTVIWYSRTNALPIDLKTIGKLFVYISNTLATIFFIVLTGVSIWWLIFYKRQDRISLVMPTTAQQASFTALVVLAFALKTIDILHLIVQQGNINIFFMDWEKSKSDDENDVSIWRTYFVANEFQELQTFRRVNLTFQLFFVLFLLKVINLENIATMEPGTRLFPSDVEYTPEYSNILRVGVAFAMWIGTAIVLYLIYVIFYQRFIEDKIINFIDLCSVSNISVFILTEDLYGYYIHGLSPHGTTEVNIKDMIMNLERESNQLSASRGLQAKSNDQTFIIHINRLFRKQYNDILKSYQPRLPAQIATAANETSADALMRSYRNLNKLLCAFISHSLPDLTYSIRQRMLLEKLLNYEFTNAGQYQALEEEPNIFYVDKDKNFMNAIFAGHENSLFIWNTATFLFIDYFAYNYVLAAIITYLLNFIAEKLCMSFARKNISAKTLIPKNFLI